MLKIRFLDAFRLASLGKFLMTGRNNEVLEGVNYHFDNLIFLGLPGAIRF